MSTVGELLNEQVVNFANTLTVSGTYVEINLDTWTVSGSGMGTHSLTSTDLPSAQDETDTWLASNGHKRVSVWYGNGQTCIAAF